ncbi:MAG: 3-phosphoshikimate 1-carboxyvinyltransferase [Chthonomonas sp.]|nr:3-phosphoshikimate 1-carboxyvinyltransferase [Chthonomonas sp.]
MELRFGPALSPPRGEITPPADKSLTHRALIFGALANSTSEIHNPLTGEDCRATRRILEMVGMRVEESGDVWRVQPATWTTPTEPVDCGNSGTTMRLLMGVFASRPMSVEFVGDASLSRRPMGRIGLPLKMMGAKVEGEKAPVRLTGGTLRGIDYLSPVASAQIKSAILLAGVRAEGETSVDEPEQSRDHTERLMEALGVPLTRCRNQISVQRAEWGGFEFRVPGDISSAAFALCLVAGSPGAQAVLRGVSVNPTRSGLLDVLAHMGASVTRENERAELGEPLADLVVSGPPGLKPFVIEGELVPRLIDEIPVLSVLATQAHGTSVVRGAAELRVKESDRIAQMAKGLRAMGASVDEFPDGMAIHGPVALRGATIDAHGDHRLAMSFAIAGLLSATGDTTIRGADSIATSYPGFVDDLRTLGVTWSEA